MAHTKFPESYNSLDYTDFDFGNDAMSDMFAEQPNNNMEREPISATKTSSEQVPYFMQKGISDSEHSLKQYPTSHKHPSSPKTKDVTTAWANNELLEIANENLTTKPSEENQTMNLYKQLSEIRSPDKSTGELQRPTKKRRGRPTKKTAPPKKKPRTATPKPAAKRTIVTRSKTRAKEQTEEDQQEFTSASTSATTTTTTAVPTNGGTIQSANSFNDSSSTLVTPPRPSTPIIPKPTISDSRARSFLDDNVKLLRLMRENIERGKMYENIDLMLRFRSNVSALLGCLESMPPLPVKLNTFNFLKDSLDSSPKTIFGYPSIQCIQANPISISSIH